jgi:hypothetical protein
MNVSYQIFELDIFRQRIYQERPGMGGHELNSGLFTCDWQSKCNGSLASETTTESSREKAHARKIDDHVMHSVFFLFGSRFPVVNPSPTHFYYLNVQIFMCNKKPC